MSDRYELVIAPPPRRALADRAPAQDRVGGLGVHRRPLRDSPQRVVGHALRAPFEGHWSARRGTYRVRYRIDEGKHTVVVLDILPRAVTTP